MLKISNCDFRLFSFGKKLGNRKLSVAKFSSAKIYWPPYAYPTGLQRDVVYLCWPIAPSYTSPIAGGCRGGGENCWASAMSTASVHITWHGVQINFGDPTSIRSTSIFADPGCLSRIPDPTFFHPGSRIRIKEFKYFNPKKWFLSSRKYDPGCSSRIPDPGVKKAPDPGSATLFNRWPTQTAVMLAPPPRPLRSSSCPADRPPQLLVGWPAHTCKSTPIRARIFSTFKEPNNRF
jgi:hypothetical protein